ncbi:MAG: 2-amino-4-hydroxy-6-hydroxymethyldihydropteridine diphosphokinase [Actinobacteria bacterium]|nr:2-amino-4-hydroxy-6-hydroxymethyldihydropteridine diphosphokinase [Actinomycetota bacterium]
MIQAALSIGSNLGQRLANLQFAIDQLEKNECQLITYSSVYETEPVGGVEQGPYLNAVVIVETELEPLQLLHAALSIEDLAHRVRDVRWGPRTLDIDVIDIAGFSSATEELTVPHPRAHERAFVLTPLLEVAPDWKLGGEKSLSELLGQVVDQKVSEIADLKLKGAQA